MATVIKQGSVAERISQLQAKLDPTELRPSPSPSGKRLAGSPVASVLSRYSTSNLRCSPNGMGLPKTPARSPVTGFRCSGYDSIQGSHRKQINRSLTGRYAGDTDHIATAISSSPSIERSRHLNIDSKEVESSGINDTCEQFSKDQVPDVAAGTEKNAYASASGGAYSKIEPFMHKPPIASYVPRRQSQIFDVVDELSPHRLRKVDSFDVISANLATSPGSSGSPRRRDDRSLRRRTMNVRSEEVVEADVNLMSSNAHSLRSTSGITAVEDIFVDRIPKPELAPPDSSQATFHAGPANGDTQDTPKLDYVPSVMPRRISTRHLRSRNHRGASTTTAQDLTTTVPSTKFNSTSDAVSQSSPSNALEEENSSPAPEDDLRIQREYKIAQALATGDGTFSDLENDISGSSHSSNASVAERSSHDSFRYSLSHHVSQRGPEVIMNNDTQNQGPA